MAGREKNKGVDKKVGGTQDNGLGFCEKEIFMPFECVSMRVWGCTALLLAGLMCVPGRAPLFSGKGATKNGSAEAEP